MHRPRHRRRDPRRTGPIRNAGEAWRESAPPEAPWEPEDYDDPASYGVRVGSRVIDEQIRRGRRTAQHLHREPRPGVPGQGSYRSPWPAYEDEEPRYQYGRSHEPHRSGGLLGMPSRHLDRLCREILHQIITLRPNPWRMAELLLRLQIEVISELARLGFGALGMAAPRGKDFYGEDVDRIMHGIDEAYGYGEEEYYYDDEDDEDDEEPWFDEPRRWPVAPSTSTTIRSTVPIPVYVSSYEEAEIDLRLPAGSQSLELEIEPTLVAGVARPVRPPFAAEFVALQGGLPILVIEVPRDLPAGLYQRRILVRASRDPIGDVTVQIGAFPLARQEEPGEEVP